MTHSTDDLNAPTSPRGLRGLWRDFLIALSFLTRLPVVSVKGGGNTLGLRAFPLVGIVVGGLGAIGFTLAAAAGLSDFVAGAIAVVVMIAVSGGLHHDGLADVADGFGGGKTQAEKLTIMRDSRIGSYGVLALVGTFALQVFALADFDSVGWASAALVGAAVLSRFALLVVLYQLPNARNEGLGAYAAGVSARVLKQAALATGVIGLCLLPFGVFVASLIFVAGALALFMGIAYLQIKGQTGDVCGAAQQISETVALLVLASFL